MRIIFAAVIALCSFLYPQMNIAMAGEAPPWLAGEYAARLNLPSGVMNFFAQIGSGTVEADGRLTLDIQTRNDRNRPDWTPVQSYEAKLISPERANIAFVTKNGARFDLVARPDGSLSGTAVNAVASGSVRFTKRR